MATVYGIDRIEELAGLRSVWASLLAETAGASFFQSLQWLEVYWKHYSADQKLRVLIVSKAGEPIGIVPLVVRRERTRLGTVRVLTYPLDDWGSFYGPIGADPSAVLSAGLEHIRQSQRDWDIIDLRWAGAPGTDHRHTGKAMHDAGFKPYRTVWNRAAVVELAGTWDDYLAARPSKWRNNFRRVEKKLADRGEITYLRYRPGGHLDGDGDPRWDLYDACEQIARRSWQGSSKTGTTLTHPTVRQYLRDSHAAAARNGGLDVNLLLVAGRPLAFAYNYYWHGRVYGLRVGYDGQLTRDGAGSLLYTYAIKDSFQRGDTVYDFGVGSLEIKRYFLTAILPIFRYSHFHPAAPRAQLLRLKRWAQELLHERATTPAGAAESYSLLGSDGAASKQGLLLEDGCH